MLSGRMNQSEELATSNRGDNQHSRKATTRSPQVSPNDPKYMHCIRPLDTRKRKLSKNSESLRLRSNDSQRSQTKRCAPLQSSLHEIYQELLTLKNQYRSLKQNYNELLKEKTVQAEQAHHTNEDNLKLKRELERMKMQGELLVQEVGRARREASKLVEVEVFKNKKLEETLQEKEQLIQLLKAKFELGSSVQQNTVDTKENSSGNRQNLQLHGSCEHQAEIKSASQEQKFLLTSISSLKKNQANTLSEDSLTFSKEKQYSTINGVRLIGSPRNGFPNLLHYQDRVSDQSECRFVALDEHVFRKKMKNFVEDDNLESSLSPQSNVIITSHSPDVTKKRSTTTIAAKPKRKTTISKQEQDRPKKGTPNISNLRIQTDFKRKKTSSKMEKHTQKIIHR